LSIKTKYAVGIDLGGTSIKIGMVSQSGKIIKRLSIRTDSEKGPAVVVNNIITGIVKILSETNYSIKGIGIGCPGTVNSEKGTVENPPNFDGWGKVNLKKKISSEFNKEVFIENDANAAAIGEMIFGNGKNINSFVMVTLGTGVGGGIIINRNLYHGEFGGAGEIGHLTINYNGPRCKCGSKGCIEAYVGKKYFNQRVQRELKKHKDSLLWKIIDGDLNRVSPKYIQKAAEKGDEFSINTIKKFGYYLGTAFSSLSNTLDIGTYIIGGGVAGFGRLLFDSINKTLKQKVLIPIKPNVKVLSAKLKNDAGIKGASALVFYGF
jgi:glucokinase